MRQIFGFKLMFCVYMFCKQMSFSCHQEKKTRQFLADDCRTAWQTFILRIKCVVVIVVISFFFLFEETFFSIVIKDYKALQIVNLMWIYLTMPMNGQQRNQKKIIKDCDFCVNSSKAQKWFDRLMPFFSLYLSFFVIISPFK